MYIVYEKMVPAALLSSVTFYTMKTFLIFQVHQKAITAGAV